MKVLRIAAAAVALLAGPAYAQMPPMNLLQDGPGKSPAQQAADEARDKAYKESLRKIPDAKAPSDPWGTVRSDKASASGTSAAKTTRTSAAKASNSKTAASAKPKPKTGTDAN
jgi:hypothetical protein